MWQPTKRRARSRRGTTAVETAMILPVFVLFIYGIAEYGRAQMVANMLQAACRMSARMGSTEGVSTDQVAQRVRDILRASGVAPDQVAVMVKNAGVYDAADASVPTSTDDFETLSDIELNDAEPRQMFLVRASISYDEVSIIPLPLIKNLTLTGQAFMRHE